MTKIPYYNTINKYLTIKHVFDHYSTDIYERGIFFDGVYTDLLINGLLNHTGYRHVVPCSNGTSALFIMALFYRKWFDKALTTPVTYRATHNALLRAGYKLQFTRIDEYLLGDYSKLNDVLNVSVGLFGKQPNLNENNINVEDACQNWINSTSMNSKAISFDPTKNISSNGNGGAILTNDIELFLFANQFINNGSDVCGLNMRITELEAAYVYSQLDYIDQWQNERKVLAKKYNRIFKTSLYDGSEDHDLQKYVIHKSELHKAVSNNLQYKEIYPNNTFTKDYVGLPMYPGIDI